MKDVIRFSELITCVMISRLVINLRSLRTTVHGSNRGPIIPETSYDKYTVTEAPQNQTVLDTIIWNLAEESAEDLSVYRDANTLEMQDL
jgi:hypothetical protein